MNLVCATGVLCATLMSRLPGPAAAAESGISCPAHSYRVQRIIPGLNRPNGLLVDDADTVYVAEKGTGTVTGIAANGARFTVMDDLRQPDGMAFDNQGRILVVEDAKDARLYRSNPDGTERSRRPISPLRWPEGIVVTPNNTVIITESTSDDTENPAAATSISRWFDDTATLQQLDATLMVPVPEGTPMQYSYAGLALHTSGMVYATNELAGTTVDKGLATIKITLNAPPALDNVDVRIFSTPLKNPKGIHFSHDGDFPLLIADAGNGRVAARSQQGDITTVCQGFQGVEDVVEGNDGRLYVSERGPAPDGSTGRVVVLAPQQPQPGATPQRIFLPLLTN